MDAKEPLKMYKMTERKRETLTCVSTQLKNTK